jgi:hypothetical protein
MINRPCEPRLRRQPAHALCASSADAPDGVPAALDGRGLIDRGPQCTPRHLVSWQIDVGSDLGET